jgi:hypothetical protein
VQAQLTKKQFSGGLYASISTRLNEIGERWQALYHWTTSCDKYELELSRQWLEEFIDFETFLSADENTCQLDLLAPIKPMVRKMGG